MHKSNFTLDFIAESKLILDKIDINQIDNVIDGLKNLRESHGRLFIVGLGGSAGNAQHATNDFRKLAGIETYAPTDNVSELTARVNDEGFNSIFDAWLKVSNFNSMDGILVLSVGGGSIEKDISVPICRAVDYCLEKKGKIFGIVGRDGGYVASKSKNIIIIPTVNSSHVTPHSESFQAVVWHLMVSHPKLKLNSTKW